MNILFVIYDSLYSISGGYNYDREIISRLVQRGHSISLYSLPSSSYIYNIVDNLRADFIRLVHAEDPHLIIQDELVHPSLFLVNIRLARSTRVPVVSLVHHLRSSEDHTPQVQPLYEIVERSYFKTIAGCIYNSVTTQHTVEQLTGRSFPGVVAPPGRERESITSTKRHQKEAEGAFRILFVGNVIPRKGLDVLLQSLQRCSRTRWKLVVAGDLTVKPAYVERIRHQIIAHGFQDRVDLLGQVSDDRLQALYAHCDVLAVPSRYEGFGMVYLEAMAHGKPVIATTAGAAHEFVCDAKTGFLVPPGDARQLADRLDLMMRQPARRRRMGRRAYEVWRHHPTWSDTAEMIERFLQGIISRVA